MGAGESEHRPYPDVRSEKQRIHGASFRGHSREGEVPVRGVFRDPTLQANWLEQTT